MAPIAQKKSINMGNISTASLIANNPGVAQPATRKPVAFAIDPQQIIKPIIPVKEVIQTPQQIMKPFSQELPATNPRTLPNGQPIMASNVSPQELQSQPKKKSQYIPKSDLKTILDRFSTNDERKQAMLGLVQRGYVIEGVNDPQSQIKQAPIAVAPQVTYGENKLQDQKQPGSLRRGIASLGGDLGAAEWLNPVGKVFENIDNSIQKIPVVTKDNIANAFNKLLPGFGDSMVEGGGPNVIQMLANTPGSLLKTASATARGMTNPVDTMQGLYKLVATDEGQQVIKDRYGSIDNFAKSMDQDPVGVASDILTVVQGGAGIASKGARLAGFTQFADDAARLSAQAGGAADLGLGVGMEKLNAGVAGIASKPLRIAAKTTLAPTQPLKTVGDLYKSIPENKPGEVSFVDRAISAYNGLDSETVRQMKDQPEIVKALDEGKITKESIKNDLIDAVDQSLGQKKEVGSQYKDVYKNNTRYNTIEIVDDINIGLTDQGVIIKGGKIVGFDTTKMTGLTDQSKSALKGKYIDTISTLKSKKDIGVEELHNIRKDLYSTSYQDGLITKKAPGVSKVSDIINERLKKIPGFEAADAGYKEAADLAKEIKDNVMNKDGDFKGTLKALLGEKGSKRLDILDKHFPGLKDKIKTLSAYDDYLNTRNRKKVGMYEKMTGGAIGAIGGATVGGPLGLFVGLAGGIVGPILRDFITDPKWFKNYIIGKAGKEIASKIELGTPLDVAEKTRLNRIISELEKDPQKALPYKPAQATPVTPDGKAVVNNPLSPKTKASSNTIIEKISTQPKIKPKTSIVPKSEGQLIKGVPELGTSKRPIITPQTYKQGVSQKTTIEKGTATKPGTTKIDPKAIVKQMDEQIKAKKNGQEEITKIKQIKSMPLKNQIDRINPKTGEGFDKDGKSLGIVDKNAVKQGETPVKTVTKKTETKIELKKEAMTPKIDIGNRTKEQFLQDIAIDDEKLMRSFLTKLGKENKVNPFMIDKYITMIKEGVMGDRVANNLFNELESYKIRSKKATVDQELQTIAKKVKEKSIEKSEKEGIIDGMKSKELQPLYEEARKYKSAEEFIKSKGKPLYHGTKSDFYEFSNDKINKTNGMEYGVGIYSTPDKSYAGNFGNIKQIYTDIKKPFNLEGNESLVTSVEKKIGFTESDYKIMKGKGKYVEREVATEVLKRNGYDGVIGSNGNEVVVFDPKNIKTKPQLRKIREEANKGILKKSS